MTVAALFLFRRVVVQVALVISLIDPLRNRRPAIAFSAPSNDR